LDFSNKATSIKLFDISTTPMRTFHMTWFAFFLCFFGWFGIAPLMAVVRDDLNLTAEQVGNTVIASVLFTVFGRFFIGWLCDKIGPRKAYTYLLVVGAIPVMGIGLATTYESFLLFRLAIGAIGASFVVTQYHTSVMFAPNVVGTANATTAGWGNLGAGVTQAAMPMLLTVAVWFVASESLGWRVAMVIPGITLLLVAFLYWKFTVDSPGGNYSELRANGQMASSKSVNGTFLEAAKDHRVWALFLIYGACFGIELTMNNIAALYYFDYFDLNLRTAGLVAALFGGMNIFTRTLGGFTGDKCGRRWGLKGRVRFMGAILFLEGLALIAFSRMTALPWAIGAMILTGICVQMSNGATFSVVPFINKRALGSVAGIVGAGGNAGAVAAGFLFRSSEMSWPNALLILGVSVTAMSTLAFLVRFSEADERAVIKELEVREAEAIAA
jgi:NNP family nitrate/nitrite transporter-like MFS transporter